MESLVSPETKYSSEVSLEHRARFAQFFTPEPIAKMMASWLLPDSKSRSILDPAFGLGVFARTIFQTADNATIYGYEVDEVIAETSSQIFDGDERLQIELSDYLFSDWNSKFDGIICNPPYFKFHDYDNLRMIAEVKRHVNLKISGFTNLYALFLIKSVMQLKDQGRLAYIVPSEFLNTGYGEAIKSFLISSGMLRLVAVINYQANVFDDALTTACIILCANDGRDGVTFVEVKGEHDYDRISNYISEYPNGAHQFVKYPATNLNPLIKWKTYYQPSHGRDFSDLVPFTTFAKVKRGIATGANNFFCLSPNRAADLGLDARNLLPCICRSADVQGYFFDEEDLSKITSRGDKSIYLFNATDVKAEAVQNYIRYGESSGIDRKHLTWHRTPWYALEKQSPAPIWVSVFNRTGVRFVHNLAGLANLTTFHGVYPVGDSGVDNDILFAYLITPTANSILSDNCREYGNGLSKFEPNDLNKAMVVDLRLLSDDELVAIRRHLIRLRNGDESAVEDIDKIVSSRYRDRNVGLAA